MPKSKVKISLNERVLQDVGLSENEASLYIIMLTSPKVTAQELAVKSPFPRTMLYYILKKLEEKNLISSKKEKWKTVYRVQDPERLYDLLATKETEFEKQKQAIKELIPSLKESYHLKNKRPSVKVFEGLETYEKILEDSLLSGVREIYAYEHFFPQKPALETRESYDRKRVLKRIHKKVLFFEDQTTLKELLKIPYNDYTVFKSVKQNTVTSFQTDVLLYNGKILYTTYCGEQEPVAILVEDMALYQMQKHIFESLWKDGLDRTLYFTQENKRK